MKCLRVVIRGCVIRLVLGHEATGIVEAVADDVLGLQPGQNVLINPVISCRRCDCCARGDDNPCRNAGIFGREIEGSEPIVHIAICYLHPLPPNLSLAEVLIETLAIVHHAQKRIGQLAGETIIVLGQGTTGLLHTALARLTGADMIIAVPRTRQKLELAERMGAHHVVQADVQNAVEEAIPLTHGRGADVAIDTVGSAETLHAGIAMLRPGGVFCLSRSVMSRSPTLLRFRSTSRRSASSGRERSRMWTWRCQSSWWRPEKSM